VKKTRWKKTLTCTRTPNVYKITLVNQETGEESEPEKCYEARRLIEVAGVTKKKTECFSDYILAKNYAHMAKEIITAEVAKTSLPSSRPIFMHDLFERFVKCELDNGAASSKRSRLTRKRHLKFFLRASVTVESVTPELIDRWVRRMRDPRYLRCQHSTRLSYREEFKLLKLVLNFYRETYDFRFPMPTLRRHQKKLVVRTRPTDEKKKMRVVDQQELVAELARQVAIARVRINRATDEASRIYFEEQWQIAKRVHVIARLQWPLGGRIQDIPGLMLEDARRDTKCVVVARRVVWIRSAGGEAFVLEGLKAGKGKIVPSASAVQIMLEWAMQEGIREGYLFFYKGKPISYRQIGYRYDKAFKALGLEHRGTHVIRHGAGTNANEFGGMKHAQKLLGHGSSRTTENYVGVQDEDFKETVARMDDAIAGTRT